MGEDKVEIKEANIKDFEKELQAKEEALKKSDDRFLKRLVEEAKSQKVIMKSEEEFMAIGEKGMVALIEQQKKFNEQEEKKEEPVKKEDDKAGDSETKGETTTDTEEYLPSWREGAIKVQGNEMWADWRYNSFKESRMRAICGKPSPEDFY